LPEGEPPMQVQLHVNRQQKGREKQAAESFKKAWELAPESFAGQIGQRIYNAWYDKKE